MSLSCGGESGVSIGWMYCICRCFYLIRKRKKGVGCGINVVSVFVGGLSSLLGVGGGIMMVPFLTWCDVRMLRAVGASAACGLAVSSMGSLGYLWAGLHTSFELPPWSFGYIYLPALAGIISVSLFTAPFGVKIAKLLPIKTLKRVFALLLLLVGSKILIG